MPATRRAYPPDDPSPDREPPWYEATGDLYVHSPEADAMPALAYRVGDRVVPDVVEANGWAGKVRIPDIFAGQLTATPAPPLPEATAPASPSAGPTGTDEE